MASVTVWVVLCNGEQAGAKVRIENDYPDALSQAVRACADAISETMEARRRMSDE